AIEYLERARHRDPLSALVAYSLAHVYAQAGRMDEAYTEIERGLGFGAYESLLTAEAVVVGFASGNPDLVVKWVTSSIEQEPTSRPVNGAMLELFGDRDASLRRLHELYDADESGFLHDAIAIWATYYGDHDLALGALSKVSLPWLFWMPSTAEIRQLPEFKDLVQDFGLLDYWQEYGWGEYCRPVGIDSFECNE
ncbi:MAG: hypothetical protein QNJ73_17590, partial [Gammaproteobacteria bacterium]|nr:hypothetical protein [Gammaproteobacteria bacterium]